ncbi:fibroblast growth factor receptor substrate 2-like [Centruroides vittatus]|uniref:fibroblast growth factor receptor substrate 2-like n=1 Tax=Centruroides vittatus TaxID=120091 RepID=UPI00350FE68E
MGCMFTKGELENSNPRVFHVWNVNDLGRHVNPGKIEVTEVDLILRQKGKTPIHWPLRSLRRYGFDAELFSFESGRRCPTGPGIYAFKCRRAEALFNVLQECIQNSGGGNGTSFSVSSSNTEDIHNNLTNSVNVASNSGINGNVANQTPSVDMDGYLEPITSNNSSVMASHSQTGSNSMNGFVSFPSGTAVESSTTVQADCRICNQNANSHYANETVFANTTSKDPQSNVNLSHQYVNSSVITENAQKKCKYNNSLQRSNVNTSLCMSSSDTVFPSARICPSDNCCLHCMSCVDLNTNYAKLDDLLKQEQSVKQHFYVNVKPEKSSTVTVNKNIATPSCQVIENATVTLPSNQLKSPVVHFYANLNASVPNTSSDLTDAMGDLQQVNYIVLDLDHSTDGKEQVVSPISSTSMTFPPCSPHQTPEGYATIDFDKTAALSNSSNPYLCNDDSVRKTRHNGTIPLS